MKRALLNLILFSLIGSLGILLVNCGDKSNGVQEERLVKVNIYEVGKLGNQTPQEYIGTAQSGNTINLSFLTGGTIDRMYVREGEKVSKGQLLATLNTTSLHQLHQGTLASLQQAEDAYNRLSSMFENQSLPEIELVDVRTKLNQAKSTEAIARKRLHDASLYAPISGYISAKRLETGMNVQPSAPVYTLENLEEVKIKIPIPEGEIASIAIGDSVRISVTALSDKIYQAEIVEKGVVANPISHTYDVKAKIIGPAPDVKPGMVVRANIRTNMLGQGEGILTIPLKAVMVDYTNERFVWVVGPNNRMERKPVVLGKLRANHVEIVDGLQSNEKVVLEGYQHISEGSVALIVN